MARSSTTRVRTLTLAHRVTVELSPAKFHAYESTRYLDAGRLARSAHARFELGYFDSGCCKRTLRAFVANGRVTRLELEPCNEPARLPPEWKPILQAAYKAIRAELRDVRPMKLPTPVAQFLAGPLGPYISGFFCIRICAFGHCLFCCFRIQGGGPTSTGWRILAACALDRRPL